MRKIAYFIGITIVVLGLLLWHDYHNYFHGGSFINYKKLPLNLCAHCDKTYEKVNGEYIYPKYFSFINNDLGEYLVGRGFSIPTHSDNVKFEIENIVSYYYSSNDILIQCIDTEGKLHWIKPFQTKGQLYFDEVAGIDNFDLQNYKYIEMSNYYWPLKCH